jgi:hypothetical protein
MISFCVPFYPWYREYERTQEVFDVLIAGLNNVDGVEDFELCLVNAAVVDVWNYSPRNPARFVSRDFNSYRFKHNICKKFKGNVRYLRDENSISWESDKDSGKPRFWVSKAIDTAVGMASNDYIVISGIDLYFMNGFQTEYFERVKEGSAWVIFSTKSQRVKDIKLYESNELKRSYYTAKGIVGITKKDYYDLGGLDCSFIKDRVDSNFYERLEKSNLKLNVEYVDSVYHISHPGSHG